MVDAEIAEEGGRLLASAIAALLEDASAYAADEAIAPLGDKAKCLAAVGDDLKALAGAMSVLTRT